MASTLTAHSSLPSPNGNTIFYEQEGNPFGPALLFIHGLGGTTNVFQPLISGLQLEYNLIRFDLSGHGRSTVPESSSSKASIESYVADCETVLRHLELRSVALVAHSLGCLVATHLAASYPALVTHLVLLGPVSPPPPAAQEALRARAAAVRQAGMAAVADAVLRSSLAAATLEFKPEVVSFARQLLCGQDPEGYAQGCEALAAAHEPEWERVAAEVAIVSGGEDAVSDREACETVQQLLGGMPRANLFRWFDVGHWYTLENPRDCVEAIRRAMGFSSGRGPDG